MLAATLGSTFYASANYSFTFGSKNRYEESICLTGWSGTAPADGRMVIPDTYTDYNEGKVYRVTSILDHALDNIPDVKEIVISRSVEEIGDADYIGTGGVNNFYNCPNLEKFTVSEDNRAFLVEEGTLRQRYSGALLRVPQKVSLPGNIYTVYISYDDIAKDAFEGNTTITTIKLYPHVRIPTNSGFNTMKQLAKFENAGESIGHNITIQENILYNADRTIAIACPPAQNASALMLADQTIEIADYAFANVKNMRFLQLGSPTKLQKIGKRAFMASGISSFGWHTWPAELGEGCFEACPNLTAMGITGSDINFPVGAFRNCPNLTEMNINGQNCTLGRACFAGCSQLKKFRWYNNLDFTADSIFANCGFTEIEFMQCTLPEGGITMGNAMFYGNQNLTKVDMSRLKTGDYAAPVRFLSDVTANCPKLKTFLFPPITNFIGSSNDTPNMGMNSDIETILLGFFTLSNKDMYVFNYNDKSHNPVIYYTPNENSNYQHPLKYLFGFGYPGFYDLTVYSQTYDPTFGDPFTRYDWIVPNATYWVPGKDNFYRKALDYNCKINEMFGLSYYNVNGMLQIRFELFSQPTVKITRVEVNDTYAGMPTNGVLTTNFTVDEANRMYIEYTVNGYKFCTYYHTIEDVQAGVDQVETDATTEGFRIIGRQISFVGNAEYTLCDLTGKTLVAGKGDTADLSDIPAGIYLIKTGNLVKKIVLK